MSIRSAERSEPTAAGAGQSSASPHPPADLSTTPRHPASHDHRAGRRRSAGPRRPRLSPRTVLLGVLLVVTGYVAVSLGAAIFNGGTGPATPRPTTFEGTYVAASVPALGSRDATHFNRAAARPSVLAGVLAAPGRGKAAATAKSQQRLVAQYRLLRRAAANAEKYAKRLTTQDWVYPTSNFQITALFGERGPHWASGYHTGVDFATAYGTPVVAVGNGTIAQTGWDGPYGNQIRLQLPNGDQVWYNHLSSIEVTPGQPVLKGQELGRVGDTGNAFGFHLHLEYRLASDLATPVDPLPYFRQHGLRLQ